ncbi:unnamed protein product, partial [Choristocarpus tenellus]
GSRNRKARTNGKGKGSKAQMAARSGYWATQLCSPEWMLSVPTDLDGKGSRTGEGWYVTARPEGRRMLLISSNGETVARQMNGGIAYR